MFLKSVEVTNFLSFKGKHQFQFQERLNYVFGSGGTGKTNLARALEFAVLGKATHYFPSQLINDGYKEECEKKGERPFCIIEAVFKHEGEEYSVRRKLSLLEENKTKQSATVPSEISKAITRENFRYLHLDWRTLEFEQDHVSSTSTRVKEVVLKHLERNVELGIRLAILDGLFSYFDRTAAEELLSQVNSMDLDQVIIMQKYADFVAPGTLSSPEFKSTCIHNLDMHERS